MNMFSRHKSWWTDERDATLCSLINAGKTYAQTAKAMQISRGQVASRIWNNRYRLQLSTPTPPEGAAP